MVKAAPNAELPDIIPNCKTREKNIKDCGYPYKFSIITAVYKVENVLRETIESVLAQDIGFARNVQLILVDDGSPDGSGEICDEYARRYPGNIIVIHKENGGVASARNAGLEQAEGKYLNFLDSDDKFSSKVLRKVYKFFERRREETDVVTIPLYFFDAVSSPHWQNWKFDSGSRVIDLQKEYQTPCMVVAASFLKNERKEDMVFDSRLASGEDMKVVFGQLYPKLTLGVVSEVKYMYRRQGGGTSLIQTSTSKKEWYLYFVPCLVRWAYDFYLGKLGYFPAFAQYTLLCDYQWHILNKSDIAGVLSPEETQEYKEQLYGALKLFDDRYIMEQKKIFREHKLFLLAKKHGSELEEIRMEEDRSFCAPEPELLLESDALCKICFLGLKENVFSIEGWTRILGLEKPDDVKVFLKVNGKFLLCEKTANDRSVYFLDELLSPVVGFQLEFPLDAGADAHNIGIYVEIGGHMIKKKNLRFSDFCPVAIYPVNSYFYDRGRVLTCKEGTFSISPCGKAGRLYRELKLLKELLGIKDKGARRAFVRRIACHIISPFQRRKHWIISDRINKADDNGEALFRHMSAKKDGEIACCFAIAKSSPDYRRLKKIGKVIPFRGWRYKLYSLLNADIISSHVDYHFREPFKGDSKYYADLFYGTKFVFLQHGVTKDDLSGWLRREDKNINLFITATRPEYKSILEYEYSYTEKEVKLTGFPRHDRLGRGEKKYITVMPTWRKYLVSVYNLSTGRWSLVEDFKQSRFYKFYHGLFHHPRLLAAAEQYGYTLCYMSHPNLAATNRSLTEDIGHIKVFGLMTPYREVFAESDMIVTDYSSVAFDFAYLRKPLLYCQFDADEFFEGRHVYIKGYFDYERDGFGEVVYDLESAAERVIEYMKNGCRLKDKYRRRIDATFAFNDRDNCERVYQAIKALDRGKT